MNKLRWAAAERNSPRRALRPPLAASVTRVSPRASLDGVVADPIRKVGFRPRASGRFEKNLDTIHITCIETKAVKREEQLDDDERDALVAIDEWMVSHQPVSVGSREVRQVHAVPVRDQLLRTSQS